MTSTSAQTVPDNRILLTTLTTAIDAVFDTPLWEKVEWDGKRTRIYRLKHEKSDSLYVAVASMHDALANICTVHTAFFIKKNLRVLAFMTTAAKTASELINSIIAYCENVENFEGSLELVKYEAALSEREFWRPRIN